MSKTQSLFPNKVATVVVHPTPGVGDATTIAEAFPLLPAAGGEILLREGTYTPTTTITLPVGKPVTVRGCGTNTVINLAANAICVFTVPDGQTVNTPICFENFKVIGTEVANQGVVAYNDANGLAEVYITRVDTSGIEIFVQVNDGGFNDSSPGQDDVKLHLTQCRIRPNTTDATIIVKNTDGGFNNIRTWMNEVQLEGDSIYAVPLGRSDPLWGRIADDNYFGDMYVTNCEFSIGGNGISDGLAFGVFQSFNSWIINNDSTTPYVVFYTYGSNTTAYDGSKFTNSSLHRINVSNNEMNVCYTGCQIDACSFVTFEPITFQGNQFMSTVSPYPDDGTGNPYIIMSFGTGTCLMGNLWADFDAVPTGLVGGTQACMIEIFGEMSIIGNDFSDVAPPVLIGIIEVFGSGCTFIGNRFPFAPTSGPPMKDWTGSNYYYGNSELFNDGNGITIKPPTGDGFDPTKGCLGNVFEGMRSWTGTGFVGGTATNNRIVVYQNPGGVAKTQGYLHNTGANTITVTERYTGVNQGPFTRTTTLTAGSKMPLDPYDFTGLDGSLDQQVWKYEVLISGTTIGWNVYFPAPNSVYRS